jgi:poly(3-hydroxybutyrate) depolymerase
MKRFDQSVYARPHGTGSLSLGDTGYVFVPRDCADGAACRVHIALHGCKQDAGDIDRRFVDDTGYNAWADTNHLIVLYPQTMPSSFLPFNPQACWDWWSYVDHQDSYVTKAGSQIRTIKAMLDALTARAVSAPAPAAAPTAAPTLTAVDTSDTAADLAWTPQEGQLAYRISRAGADGQFSVVGTGGEGPPSNEATASTRATPAPCNSPGSCPIGN